MKIDYILHDKAKLSKTIKIIPCILINHGGIKLEIDGKEIYKSHSNG
jgi:hypothetical protein